MVSPAVVSDRLGGVTRGGAVPASNDGSYQRATREPDDGDDGLRAAVIGVAQGDARSNRELDEEHRRAAVPHGVAPVRRDRTASSRRRREHPRDRRGARVSRRISSAAIRVHGHRAGRPLVRDRARPHRRVRPRAQDRRRGARVGRALRRRLRVRGARALRGRRSGARRVVPAHSSWRTRTAQRSFRPGPVRVMGHKAGHYRRYDRDDVVTTMEQAASSRSPPWRTASHSDPSPRPHATSSHGSRRRTPPSRRGPPRVLAVSSLPSGRASLLASSRRRFGSCSVRSPGRASGLASSLAGSGRPAKRSQKTGVSRHTPHTSRSASHISPSVT